MSVDEVHYVYFNILCSIMIWQVKMPPYGVAFILLFYVIEVLYTSIFQSSFGLSHILFATFFACNAVYNVAAVA